MSDYPRDEQDAVELDAWHRWQKGRIDDMKLPDIELVSDKVHAAWMLSKRDKGVMSRKSETGEELMVPYAELSEAAKEVDRGAVRAVYAAIEAAS